MTELNPAAPKHVFVSYTGVDSVIAAWIAEVLRSAGHAITIQSSDFHPGHNFVLKMQEALTSADHVVAVLSPAYEASGFGSAEWAAAFATDPTGADRRLIGIRVAPYQPTGLLRSVVYADLVDRTDDDAATLVRRALDPTTRPAVAGGLTSAIETAPHTWGVPSPVAHFAGRGEAMDLVSERLKPGTRMALTGYGGLGKSAVAAEWVRAHAAEFELILWLPAATQQRIEEALASAARDLGLATPASDADVAGRAARHALQATRRALVVLDDCPDVEVAQAAGIAASATVLLTSRNDGGWRPDGYEQLRLDVLTAEAGTTLLRAMAPDGGDGADLVVEALDGLPLALAQAGAYVDQHAISFVQYLDRLSTHAPRVLERPPGHEYGHTVLTVWTLALDELETASPAAASLLKLLSVVDSEDFPRAVLSIGWELLPEALSEAASDAFSLDATIATVLGQSLCRPDGDGLSVHPVVQAVIRSRMTEEEIATTSESVASALMKAFPEDVEPSSWPTWERLSPHVAFVVGLAIQREVYVDSLVPMLGDMARSYDGRGFPHFANALYTTALQYLTDHQDQASTGQLVFVVEQLAYSYLGLRAADAAASLFKALVDATQKNGQATSRGAVRAGVGLASAMTDTGNHDGALECLSTAAQAYGQMDEADPALGAHLYGTWGRLLVRRGEPEDGRVHLLKALELAEEANNKEDTALTLLHLGNSYRHAEDVGPANEHYERARSIASSLPGRQQLQAEILANIATLALGAGDEERALGVLDEAILLMSEIPEGDFTVTAANLHATRAQIRVRMPETEVIEVVAEAGLAFEVLCAHLPEGHPHRREVGMFLLNIAEAVGDDEIRSAVVSREPQLGTSPHRMGDQA